MTPYDPADYPPAPDLTPEYVRSRRWMRRAPCAYAADPDAWFPERHTDPAVTAAAVDVCRLRCPVWQECALYALLTDQRGGIAAGLRLGRRPLDNARALREELACAELPAELETLLDHIIDVREHRAKHPVSPIPLGELLTEFVATAPNPNRPWAVA